MPAHERHRAVWANPKMLPRRLFGAGGRAVAAAFEAQLAPPSGRHRVTDSPRLRQIGALIMLGLGR